MSKALDYVFTTFVAFGWIVGVMTSLQSAGIFGASGGYGFLVAFVIATISGVLIALKCRQFLWRSDSFSGSAK